MRTVVINRCEEYNLELIKEKISLSLDYLGGIENLIKKDASVFIKLNCVGPFEPDLGITTHPIFVKAVIQLIKTRTKNIVIGDNPAIKNIIYTLKKCGIYDVIIEEEIPVFEAKNMTVITNSNCKSFSHFEVSKDMIDVDVLINLPKLKTHTLTYMTVAQKNLFGFIYGLSKSTWHVRASNPLEFGEALNDLYGAILESYQNKQIINICDGILGLEGEGPSRAGNPKKANVILASLDAVSLDRVACEIADLDPNNLFVTKIAHERGYGVGELKEIQIVGDSLSKFNDIHFQAPKNHVSHWGLKLLKHKFIRNIILEHPAIDTNRCIKCGECAKICPPKTMVIKNRQYPCLNTKDCIRCWCCAEVCPQDAIKKSKRPLIGRLVIKNRQ